MKDERDWDELERLWRAVRRDVFFEVEAAAGFHPLGEAQLRRSRRLNRNWRRFCELDIDLASRLAHGFREVAMLFSNVEVHGVTPMDRHLQGLDTDISLADVNRAPRASATATVETLGERMQHGDRANRAGTEHNGDETR